MNRVFLTDRKQFVHINNSNSAMESGTSGVPQGSVQYLVHYCFSTTSMAYPLKYTNKMSLFAVHCVICREITNDPNLNLLQNYINNASD